MRSIQWAILATVCLATPTLAAPSQTVTIRVRHADLDLSRPKDLAKLNRRAGIAIRVACADPFAAPPLGEESELGCRREAWKQMAPEIERRRRSTLALVDRTSG